MDEVTKAVIRSYHAEHRRLIELDYGTKHRDYFYEYTGSCTEKECQCDPEVWLHVWASMRGKEVSIPCKTAEETFYEYIEMIRP